MSLPFLTNAQALTICSADDPITTPLTPEQFVGVYFHGSYGLNLEFNGPCSASTSLVLAQGTPFITVQLQGFAWNAEGPPPPPGGLPVGPDSWQITLTANPGGVVYQIPARWFTTRRLRRAGAVGA